MARRGKKPKNRTGICVYCARPSVVTYEHVPPQNLFGKPLPPDLITVPCCWNCNNGGSKDDEYLRDTLAVNHKTRMHPNSRVAFRALLRSLRNPKKRGYRAWFLGRTREVDIRTPSGLYVGKTGILNVDMRRVNQSVERIVRGLYWHETRTVLPISQRVTVLSDESLREQSAEAQQTIAGVVKRLSEQPSVSIGAGTFRYTFVVANDAESMAAVCLMSFYGGVGFLAITADGTAAHGAGQ